jgi:hypothetical protein
MGNGGLEGGLLIDERAMVPTPSPASVPAERSPNHGRDLFER